MKLIDVKYDGKKPYRDRTPLRNEWEPGDVKRVPERDAKILLRFAEFHRAEEAEATDRPEDVEATDRHEDVEAAIAAQAQRDGVRDLRQSGLRKVKQGVTSLAEVLASTNE